MSTAPAEAGPGLPRAAPSARMSSFGYWSCRSGRGSTAQVVAGAHAHGDRPVSTDAFGAAGRAGWSTAWLARRRYRGPPPRARPP